MDEGKRFPPTSRILGRRMNSQMNISLPIELHEKLRTIAWEERVPLSHLCRHLLELGIKRHEGDSEVAEVPTGGN